MIVFKDGKYCLISKKTGRNLGCFDTREEAEKREEEIKRFVQEEEEAMKEQFSFESDTAPPDTPWNFQQKDYTLEQLARASAWCRGMENPHTSKIPDGLRKEDCKLPHHLPDGRVVLRGLRAAIAAVQGARGGVDIPSRDLKKVKDHLAKHMRQFGLRAPWDRQGSVKEAIFVSSRLLEEVGEGEEKGKVWEIVVIEEGLSKNGFFYTEEVLREAVPLFDGAQVFAYHFGDGMFKHLDDDTEVRYPQGFASNFVGVLRNPHFETLESGKGAILAELKVMDPRFRRIFQAMRESGELQALGFSINVIGDWVPAVIEGQKAKQVLSIDQVRSVDVVTEPSAGGRLRRLVAGIVQETKHGGRRMRVKKESLIEMIRGLFPEYQNIKLEKLSFDTLKETFVAALQPKVKKLAASIQEAKDLGKAPETEEEIEAFKQKLAEVAVALDPELEEANLPALPLEALAKMVLELLAKAQSELQDALMQKAEKDMRDQSDQESEEPTQEAVKEAVAKMKELEAKLKTLELERKKEETRSYVAQVCKEAGLPKAWADKIKEELKDAVLSFEEVKKKVERERKWLEKMNLLTPSTIHEGVQVQLEPREKKLMALAMLLGYRLTEKDGQKYLGIKPYRSIREAYVDITGDVEVRGRIMKEAVSASTDFPQLLADAVNKRAVQEFAELDRPWERFAIVNTNLRDFKTQHVVRLGAAELLATVAETVQTGAGYPESAVFSDEEATYQPERRAKIFKITDRAIINDDTRLFQNLPRKLARAAVKTVNQFVWDLVQGYDAVTNTLNGLLIYDGEELYHILHSNPPGTAGPPVSGGNAVQNPLDFSTAAEAVEIMMSQKEFGDTSGTVLGIRPAFLAVPPQLWNTAEIIRNSERVPGTPNNDVNILRGTFETILISEPRGQSDRAYFIASPRDIETLEIGFLNGQAAPLIEVQNNPTSGQVFTHDVISYRVKWDFGGAIIDFRAFVGVGFAPAT